MDLKLKDKTVMIAASSQGIAYGIAEAVAREGAHVSMASRSGERIKKAASVIRGQYDVEARGYTFDATDANSIEDWTEATISDFTGIDCLVINAGGPAPGKFDKFDDDAWTKAYELTLLSAVRMIRAVLPTMRKQGSGSILTVTSTSVKEPIDMLLLSNVFRSGVVSLVKSLSTDLAVEGIRINNLVPGRIDTDRVRTMDQQTADRREITVEQQQAEQYKTIPLGRYGTIDEMGTAAAFLLSDAARYITGTTLVVDGGKTRSL